MNAANEVAVEAFLNGKIGFYDITHIIEDTMAGVDFVKEPDLDNIYQTNNEALARAGEILKKHIS